MALVEFERSLTAFPRRYHSHRGAAEAALRAGKHDKARQHAGELIEMAGARSERNADLERAREILAGQASG